MAARATVRYKQEDDREETEERVYIFTIIVLENRGIYTRRSFLLKHERHQRKKREKKTEK